MSELFYDLCGRSDDSACRLFVIYQASTRSIREGIENENRMLLEQTTDILDTRFKEIENIGIQLVNSACVMQLRYLDDPLSRVNIQTLLLAREGLAQYAAYNDFLEGYLLFFNRGQVVLSHNLTYSYDDFFHQHMRPEGFSQEAWLEDLKAVSAPWGNVSCAALSASTEAASRCAS